MRAAKFGFLMPVVMALSQAVHAQETVQARFVGESYPFEYHAQVCQRGYNVKREAFTQFYGSDELDASVLMMLHVGFLPATDERVVSTVEAIQRDLMQDGFVLRYRPEKTNVDGLPGTEGVFLLCTFWLVDCLHLIGRKAEARALFERLLALRNDLGLLAEEYDPRAQRQLGNFPQAFSHVALINSARMLSEPS